MTRPVAASTSTPATVGTTRKPDVTSNLALLQVHAGEVDTDGVQPWTLAEIQNSLKSTTNAQLMKLLAGMNFPCTVDSGRGRTTYTVSSDSIVFCNTQATHQAPPVLINKTAQAIYQKLQADHKGWQSVIESESAAQPSLTGREAAAASLQPAMA